MGIREIRVKYRIYSRGIIQLCPTPLRSGVGLYSVEIELGKPGFHFLTSLELNDCPSGDNHILLRLIWVSTDSGLSYLYLEYPKVAKLDILTVDQTCADMVEGFLDDFSHMLVVVITALVDRLDDLPFRQII